MNKFKLGLLVACMGLVGCEDVIEVSSREHAEKRRAEWQAKATNDEISLLTSLLSYQRNCDGQDYDYMTQTKATIAKRTAIPNNNRSFCDVLPQIKMDSNWKCNAGFSPAKTTYLGDLFQQVYGKTLAQHCDIPNYNVGSNVTTTSTGRVISYDVYKELIRVSQTCKRAENTLLQLTDGKPLTEDKYESIMTVVSECNAFELEQALNAK